TAVCIRQTLKMNRTGQSEFWQQIITRITQHHMIFCQLYNLTYLKRLWREKERGKERTFFTKRLKQRLMNIRIYFIRQQHCLTYIKKKTEIFIMIFLVR